MITEKEVWDILEDVKDPEIPNVSVVDMGIFFDLGLGIFDLRFLK